ncbi:MAG: amidase [Betaproteobacteria bacterium]
MSAIDAYKSIQNGSLTCQNLIRSCFDRIEERNPLIHAFTATNRELALKQAYEIDRLPSNSGSLHGIPFAVKDVIESSEYITTFGSKIYAEFQPVSDAGCIVQSRERGALLIGKVDTSEFATQTPSKTCNPLSLNRTPGGSSSGSAAAVADYMVPIAFGTQTTGSIIRPAAYCGIVGYKPTFDLIPSAGLKMLSHSQDTIGILARNVADVAFFTFGMFGDKDSLKSPHSPRIGICLSNQWSHASTEITESIDRLVIKLENAGAIISTIKLPNELEDLVDIQSKVFAFEALRTLAYERINFSECLSPRLNTRLQGGVEISLTDYLQMRGQIMRSMQKVSRLFKNVDVLLYPSAEGEAEIGLLNSGSPRFGAIWTLLHLPCISIPIDFGSTGLPLGAQLIGAYCEDKKLLSIANFASLAVDFPKSKI